MKMEKFIFYIFLANFTLISAFGVLETYKEASLEVKNPFADAEKYKSDTQNYIDELNKQINKKRAEIQSYIGKGQQSSIDSANLEIKNLREKIAYLKQNLDNFNIEEINYNSAQTPEEKKEALEAARQIRGMQLEKSITIIAGKKFQGLMKQDIDAFKQLTEPGMFANKDKLRSELNALAFKMIVAARNRALEVLGSQEFGAIAKKIDQQLSRIQRYSTFSERVNSANNFALSEFYKKTDDDNSRLQFDETTRTFELLQSVPQKYQLLEEEFGPLNKTLKQDFYKKVIGQLNKLTNYENVFPDELTIDSLKNFEAKLKKKKKS